MWKFFLHKIKKTLPADRVERIRQILATVYAFTAWNLVIITFYNSIKDGIPNTEEKKKKFMEKMEKRNMAVEFVQIKGFSINDSEDNKDETNIVAI